MHISGFRRSKTPTKFHERTPRERKKNENCGGRREKKERNFGRSSGGLSGGGLSGGGLSGGGLSSGGGFTGGGPAEGSIGNGVQGSGFRVQFRFLGRKQKQNKNMKREMSKNKKKVKKSKNEEKGKKERKKKQSKHHLFDFGQLISTSANFDFGQFRLRPISTSANSISANFDFGQFDFGQLAEVELSEVELAEVEHPPLTHSLRRARHTQCTQQHKSARNETLQLCVCAAALVFRVRRLTRPCAAHFVPFLALVPSGLPTFVTGVTARTSPWYSQGLGRGRFQFDYKEPGYGCGYSCKKSAQGQTLLAGDQLDSWPGLVCPGARIEKPMSERAGCRGYTETPSQPYGRWPRRGTAGWDTST